MATVHSLKTGGGKQQNSGQRFKVVESWPENELLHTKQVPQVHILSHCTLIRYERDRTFIFSRLFGAVGVPTSDVHTAWQSYKATTLR